MEAQFSKGTGSNEQDGSPRSRCQQIWFLVRALLLVCRWLPFLLTVASHGLSSVHAFRERELSGVTSYKGTNAARSGPHPLTSFNLNYYLKGPISQYSHVVGQGFSIWILGGHKRSVCNNAIVLAKTSSFEGEEDGAVEYFGDWREEHTTGQEGTKLYPPHGPHPC